jgi:RNA polymerase sigma factor (sigma-70 family)
MANSPMSSFLQNLRRAALRRDEAGWTDGQLLETYIQSREEAAFAALVHRHGPMVWGVCRRVLGNDADAEDAFQAAFLVLVRKAACVVPREKIANWLYGVARQTAMKARAMAVKRKSREKQVTDMPELAVFEPNGSEDLLPLLDRELSRLPDKYRTAIVLCDLEGKSYKEVSQQLGCPEGTLAARLARGRAMLAKRLARQRLGVTSGALAAILSKSASACVPLPVRSATIEAAGSFAAGQAAAAGAISVQVVALTEGVLKAMLLSKLKIATALLLTAAVLSGAAGLAYQTQAGAKAPEAESLAAALAKPDAKNILSNAGFEGGKDTPAHWSQGAEINGVEYIWDKKVGKWGKASVCLHKTAQRYFPIAQWYQIVERKGDKPALRVSAQVKAEGVTKAIIDVIFLDEDGDPIRHDWASYIGAKNANDPPADHDWKEYAGRVEIPQTAKKIQIALQIYGPGKVWFDEVRAEYTNQARENAVEKGQSLDEPAGFNVHALESQNRSSSRLHFLLKERVDLLRKNAERAKRLYEQQAAGQDAVWQANLRLHKAELDLCETTKERIAVWEKIVNVYKEMEDRLTRLSTQGAASHEAVEEAKLNRLEAEIALEREKIKLAPLSK